MKAALDGIGPDVGFLGEDLKGQRLNLRGRELANGWKFAYFGFKADLKARKECHFLERSYQHSYICGCCLAARPHKNWDPAMNYKNFFEDAAHLMTGLSHQNYVAMAKTPSPWLGMPGFHIKNCFRGPMHTIFLGSAKELLASCLGYWSRTGRLPGNTVQEQLQKVSRKQKSQCHEAGLRGTFRSFTPANTGLDKQAEYPELGSCHKAASVKMSIWWFAKYAIEIAGGSEDPLSCAYTGLYRYMYALSQTFVICFSSTSRQDLTLRLIAACVWSLQAALHILDHSTIILRDADAEVGLLPTFRAKFLTSVIDSTNC